MSNLDSGAELLAAASEGRSNDVIRILEEDPELIRVGDVIGDTVFHVVARAGDVDTLRKLLEVLGSEPKRGLLKEVLVQGNGNGDTALHVALESKQEEAAYILIFHGSLSLQCIRNDDGLYPSDLAKKVGLFFKEVSGIGKSDIEMDLVRRDLSYIDIPDPVNWSGLSRAAYQGQLKEVQRILETYLDRVMEKDHTGRTALQVLAEAGDVASLKQGVQLVLTTGPGGVTASGLAATGDKNGDTALHLALKRQDQRVARYLIGMAPEASFQLNGEGVSPLHLAVKNGYDDLLVSYVFQRMPGIAVWPAAKQSLLASKRAPLAHAAIKARNSVALGAIMEHLPDLINSSDEKGWRPLSYAAYKGYEDEVVYILKNFPNSVEKLDDDGWLPIHKAVAGGHVNIVKVFLSCCPQALHHVDKRGRSILHVVVRYGKPDVLSYLAKETQVQKIFNLRDHEGKTFMDLAQAK